jgi:thioester reductase-like protein
MQKAKHIGKVMISMPDDKGGKPHMFSGDSSYLITGGLGGIGLEVARWMSDAGAETIILCSRREASEKSAKIINELLARGKRIIVRSVDVGERSEVKDLLSWIKSSDLPPLRGIMHCAGTLADATYLNQTKETYETAFRGKVMGALNLHELTLDPEEYRLEHFVLFSSIVAIFGPIGLSNYASANTFLDALAHYRNSVGLPAQSINWGQWAEVGAAANINIAALRAFTPNQGIAALETLMKSHKTQACVLEVDFSSVRKLTGHAGAYLEELKISKDSSQLAFNVKMDRFWDEYRGATSTVEKTAVIKSYVEIILRQILKFDEDEKIDENQNFSEMGMDSLMMLEMKNFLQTMLGKNVTMNVSDMQELTTVSKLVAHLAAVIESGGADGDVVPTYDTFSDDVINLINQDMVLDGDVVPEGDGKPTAISTVFMTGATGKFGPYLLQSILSHPKITKVICLVRTKASAPNPRERLTKALSSANITVDMTRVDVISGDASSPLFALHSPVYEELTKLADCVVHCAVKGNLMDPYTSTSATSGSSIRTSNVTSTLNVIRFACKSKTKPIFHCSTLLCNNKVTTENTMWEEWYSPEEVFQLKNVGYPVSKFVCEVLLQQAVIRGVPVKVFRFPALFGDSKTGRFAFPNNHAVTRLLGFCKLGYLPAIPLPIQVLCSDVAADISVDVFFNDANVSDVYNITNPHLNYFHDFAKVSGSMGFPIEIVEYEEFAEKLRSNVEYKALFPYGEVDLEEGRYVDFSTSPQALQAWLKNPDKFFPSGKLMSMFPDLMDKIEPPVNTLQRDLQFAVSEGIASKFGLIRRV